MALTQILCQTCYDNTSLYSFFGVRPLCPCSFLGEWGYFCPPSLKIAFSNFLHLFRNWKYDHSDAFWVNSDSNFSLICPLYFLSAFALNKLRYFPCFVFPLTKGNNELKHAKAFWMKSIWFVHIKAKQACFSMSDIPAYWVWFHSKFYMQLHSKHGIEILCNCSRRVSYVASLPRPVWLAEAKSRCSGEFCCESWDIWQYFTCRISETTRLKPSIDCFPFKDYHYLRCNAVYSQ